MQTTTFACVSGNIFHPIAFSRLFFLIFKVEKKKKVCEPWEMVLLVFDSQLITIRAA